jgi:hypothetical protein
MVLKSWWYYKRGLPRLRLRWYRTVEDKLVVVFEVFRWGIVRFSVIIRQGG